MKNVKYTKDYSETGNIIVSYEITKMKDNSLHIILPLVILLGIVLLEFIIFHTFYSLIIIIPLLLYFLYRWTIITIKMNESKEENIIFKNLNPIISKDINSFGNNVKELERKYVIEEIEHDVKKFVLVLLSNGYELKYNILNSKGYNKILRLEIDINAVRIK